MLSLATSGTFNPVRPTFTSYASSTGHLDFILVESIKMTTRLRSASFFVPLVVEGLSITGNVKQPNTMKSTPCDLSSSRMCIRMCMYY